ncbi:hypothetical protein BpHYR1_018612 [Brachionus plicatilis]|uniref:Uncharacterized protein n=1 Tax=Brachionus plicatilis TaxID=10195 RepID=A0A3M7SJR2_BRAPC|nr:hypothetical protein BpHYR1_018612 [Brachionus plicatilis]
MVEKVWPLTKLFISKHEEMVFIAFSKDIFRAKCVLLFVLFREDKSLFDPAFLKTRNTISMKYENLFENQLFRLIILMNFSKNLFASQLTE